MVRRAIEGGGARDGVVEGTLRVGPGADTCRVGPPGPGPEARFGSKVSPREAQRRTKTAVALSDGSLPGAAEALASGTATHAHVAALAAIKDRLPDSAAANMLSLAAVLPPDKFARALQRAALPVEEVGDASTGIGSSGGRWFRFGYDGHEGTIVLNGLEAVMDRAWRRDHPERADEKLDWTSPLIVEGLVYAASAAGVLSFS